MFLCEAVGVRMSMSNLRPHMGLLHRAVMMERVFLRSGINVFTCVEEITYRQAVYSITFPINTTRLRDSAREIDD
jgi:hypothetical protein